MYFKLYIIFLLISGGLIYLICKKENLNGKDIGIKSLNMIIILGLLLIGCLFIK